MRIHIMLGAIGLAAAAAAADVVQVYPFKDNTLYESPTGDLSNGAGSSMFAGSTLTGQLRRAVVAFDVASAVPAGSAITSVTLRMYMSKTIVLDKPVALHRATADWGEGASLAGGEQGGGGLAMAGDATWIHTFWNTQFWAAEGGDFDPVPSASTFVGPVGFYTWGSTPGMVADAQRWLDYPAENFGWVVVGDESTPGTAKRFDTREHLASANRPLLTIEFTPPCYADCNHDTYLTIADFGCFQTKFVQGDPYADCNGDTFLTIADFGCFQTKFVQGCP